MSLDRLRPTVRLDLGSVLHLDDLAADKVLALWGRAEVRDYIDVVALMERYPKDQLLRLAAEKDPGFTIPTFRDALGAIRRFDPEDWNATGVDEAGPWRACVRVMQQRRPDGVTAS